MDLIPNQHQEENIENITDPDLERLEGENIYFGSENVYKGRIQKKKITKIVNMVLSEVGGVAAFH